MAGAYGLHKAWLVLVATIENLVSGQHSTDLLLLRTQADRHSPKYQG